MNSVSGRIWSAVQDGDPVGAGELDVAEDDLRLECLDLGEGRGQVAGRRDLEALALQKLLERRGDHLLVVDDQDPAPRRARVAGLGVIVPLSGSDRTS